MTTPAQPSLFATTESVVVAEPPIQWPKPLHHRVGAPKRLGGVDVWYDFHWNDFFGHDCSQFPDGQPLSDLLLTDCPQGKTPALILHRGEDVRASVEETETHFCLVVNIEDYLKNAKGNAARTYFTLRTKRLTSLADVDIDVIGQWVGQDPARQGQLAQLVGRADIDIEAVRQWAGTDTTKLRQLAKLAGPEAAMTLLDWMLTADDATDVVATLTRLNVNSVQQLNALAGIVRLKEALKDWKENATNSNEEFWQKKLSQHAFVLSQLFSQPVIVMREKVHLGGKGVENAGGNVLDFLCQNPLTGNVLLVEIKTPRTRLLGGRYRQGLYNIGPQVSGAVLQVSKYKDTLLKEYATLERNSTHKFEAFDPACLVIAGDAGTQFETDVHVRSFELFRRELRGVHIVTFDELFAKTQLLIELLEGTVQKQQRSVTDRVVIRRVATLNQELVAAPPASAATKT